MDPVITEINRIKRVLTERCSYDLGLIFADTQLRDGNSCTPPPHIFTSQLVDDAPATTGTHELPEYPAVPTQPLADLSETSKAISEDGQLDLTRYKTGELASAVAEIVAVPESIRTVLVTTLSAVIFLLAINSIFYLFGTNVLFPWIISSIYVLIAACLLGLFLGLIRVTGLLLNRSERLLALMLESTKEILIDCRAVRGGTKSIPTSSEIIKHIYGEVIIPAMETTVSNSFGILGTPLLWIYRKTIGGVVRFLLLRLEADPNPSENASDIDRKASELLLFVDANGTRIESTMQRAYSYTSVATRTFRNLVLIPARVFFFFIAFLALIPPVILGWFLS